jgi:hypothetical protein
VWYGALTQCIKTIRIAEGIAALDILSDGRAEFGTRCSIIAHRLGASASIPPRAIIPQPI